MQLNEAYQKVCDEVLGDSSVKNDIHFALLALHESATKIWQAVENRQDEKIRYRTVSALISVFYLMRELGIENPEECLVQKMEEMKKEVR